MEPESVDARLLATFARRGDSELDAEMEEHLDLLTMRVEPSVALRYK